MKLYHGSIEIIKNPEIRAIIKYADFGQGFYTTSSEEQAARWAKHKALKFGGSGYVSVYEFDWEGAQKALDIKVFNAANLEWLNFVVTNRSGLYNNISDMHIGPVADDSVYRTIQYFEAGECSAEETIKRLKAEVLHDQWVFYSTRAIKYLKFIEVLQIT